MTSKKLVQRFGGVWRSILSFRFSNKPAAAASHLPLTSISLIFPISLLSFSVHLLVSLSAAASHLTSISLLIFPISLFSLSLLIFLFLSLFSFLPSNLFLLDCCTLVYLARFRMVFLFFGDSTRSKTDGMKAGDSGSSLFTLKGRGH